MLISNLSSLQKRKSMVNYSEVLQHLSFKVRYLNKGGKTGNRSNRTVPYLVKLWFAYRLLPVVTMLVPNFQLVAPLGKGMLWSALHEYEPGGRSAVVIKRIKLSGKFMFISCRRVVWELRVLRYFSQMGTNKNVNLMVQSHTFKSLTML